MNKMSLISQKGRFYTVTDPVAFIRAIGIARSLGLEEITQPQLKWFQSMYAESVDGESFVPYALFADGMPYMKQWASAGIKYFTFERDFDAAVTSVSPYVWFDGIEEYVKHLTGHNDELRVMANVAWSYATIPGAEINGTDEELVKLYNIVQEAISNGVLWTDWKKIKRRLQLEHDIAAHSYT
jgi:hypothetical protein